MLKSISIRHFWRVVWLVLITFDISLRTVIQYWRGPKKMTRQWSDKTIQSWSTRLLNAAKVKLHVHGRDAVQIEPGRAYIVMCNHTSHFDIPISLVALSGISLRMMAKKELYHIPVFGKAMVSADFPIVDRQNRRQSIKDLAFAVKLMKNGIIVWVAPEGTRSKTGQLGEFKPGAFVMAINAQATVIPMAIRGAEAILPTKTLNLNPGRDVEVFIGEPIDASVYTMKEKDVLLNKVKSSIANLLNDDVNSTHPKHKQEQKQRHRR